MTKKHFIQLADTIKENPSAFTWPSINTLADFCKAQNPNFNRDRWLDYIAGKCGKNGGRVKA
jgi:hypothetical protein